MNKRAELPVNGKAIRFAPGRDQEPSARFWKMWTEGNEIYALARNSGGIAKISVHASGRVHFRLGPKLKQDLAPLMQLGRGPWLHAFEIRFLLSEGAYTPPRERDSLKNKSAYLIPVPKGFVLYANLIVGAPGTQLSCPLPPEFLPAGQALWRTRLRDGRRVVLVARMLELDNQNRDHIKYLREQLKPTATFASTPSEPYIELFHVYWSPEGGNVVLVVPMGSEAIRSEQGATTPVEISTESRKFPYQSARSSTDVLAPDGRRVAVLEIDDVDNQIELVKNLPSTHKVGTLKMHLEPNNLIAGSKFMASPVTLACTPSIGGASPRGWKYTVVVRFDGLTLSAELQQVSASLQNKNFAAEISQLEDREELVMKIPSETLKILATMEAPHASTEIIGRFILRDWS